MPRAQSLGCVREGVVGGFSVAGESESVSIRGRKLAGR